MIRLGEPCSTSNGISKSNSVTLGNTHAEGFSQQRISSKLRKIIVCTDVVEAEDLSEKLRDERFEFAVWSHVGLR